tara:strand:+ start:279 stop:905 length:627 start_codon:yes stop_codon:yes gene_type:complete
MKKYREFKKNYLVIEEKSSNQVKKIKINFGVSESGYDAEWNLGKIETEMTLAMGDHSKDCFDLASDIGKFNGLKRKEAESYKEIPSDAMIYGMTNIMNGGDDIYFWTNGNRLKGAVQKSGLWPAIFEQVSHEMVHGARLLLSKHLLKKLGKEWYKGEGKDFTWPSIGDDAKVNKINEQAFAFAVGESIAQIIPDFLKMAETYIPELKK